MEDENIKQLIYDIQREKDSQKQVALVKTFEATSKAQILHYYRLKFYENSIQDETKIVPANPVAQINESSVDWLKTQEGKDDPFIFHKFAVGTKIQFPTFEKLQFEGWIDDGEHMVHPKYKTVFLSYLQIADFEDTVVTITYQNNPGEYSIEEEGLYDDWPFDLMNVDLLEKHDDGSVTLSAWLRLPEPSEKLNFDDQSLQEQAFHILHYLESETNQMIIPDGRVRLLKETLGDYKPYDEVCYLPAIKNMKDKISVQDLTSRTN